jgi:arylsulfatase
VSDNGASGEGGPNGSFNENKMFNGLSDTAEANLPHLDELGSPATYNHYPTGWACAFNTPVQAVETVLELGGRHRRSDDGVLAGSDHLDRPASSVCARHRHRAHPVLTARDRPARVKGYPQFPLEGISFEATLNDADASTDKQTQFYSMGGTRAIWHQGWKAAAISPSAPDMWAHYGPAVGAVQHRGRPERVP